jgi:hypothetical protein
MGEVFDFETRKTIKQNFKKLAEVKGLNEISPFLAYIKANSNFAGFAERLICMSNEKADTIGYCGTLLRFLAKQKVT